MKPWVDLEVQPNPVSLARRRRCVEHMQRHLHVSERFACKVLGQHRSTQRKLRRGRTDEDALTRSIITLASEYGRYGYRRIWALLREQGWNISGNRVERIWRRATDRSGRHRWGAGGTLSRGHRDNSIRQNHKFPHHCLAAQRC